MCFFQKNVPKLPATKPKAQGERDKAPASYILYHKSVVWAFNIFKEPLFSDLTTFPRLVQNMISYLVEHLIQHLPGMND